MPEIRVLDKHTAELIAAGEVVERPASVVKELMENAIDAGATVVTVEIKNGGVSYIRITDNGCGIARGDVPTAFLRHATSKVRTSDDLDAIGTLGFRGEALASVSAVARVELLTRFGDEIAGTRYVIEGGEGAAPEDAGCPQGTTIIVRDLFYNVPARMKFLKKDVSEANAVAGAVERVALSHPELAVRFIRDGREELLTPGDGKLLSCIYAVFGKDFAAGMLPVDYRLGGIQVGGYIGSLQNVRANRSMQHFFVNGRYVKTRTAMVALEEGYKGSIMTGKFPSCVLHITIPAETVDVNVHPAKIEVRFINERPLFEAVHYAVKSALHSGDAHVPLKLDEAAPARTAPPTAGNIAANIAAANIAAANIAARSMPEVTKSNTKKLLNDISSVMYDFSENQSLASFAKPKPSPDIFYEEPACIPVPEPDAVRAEQTGLFETRGAVAAVGEVFGTYILAQMDDTLYFIDKHAAHERMLYDELKANGSEGTQMLLEPVSVPLSREEYGALAPELALLEKAGFDIEDFGGHSVLVRAVPMMIGADEVIGAIQEIAGGLAGGKREITTDKLDWIVHSTACRAAVKAGDRTGPAEWQSIAERVLLNEDIRTCPHGRPVCFSLSRREMEKKFGRIQ